MFDENLIHSTGTDSSNAAPTGPTVPLLSTNALSHLGTLSCITSTPRTRLVRAWVISTRQSRILIFCTGTFWYHSHLSTQYCDGLRGPIVVYDPADPHASLYDVDDGEPTYIDTISSSHSLIDSTVITLADWYHTLARVGPKFP